MLSRLFEFGINSLKSLGS